LLWRIFKSFGKEAFFMTITKIMFFQSLALISVLAVINVYAADRSICNDGGNVALYDDGSLKACQLKDDYDVDNISCKNYGPISFYPNGNLESCELAREVTIGGYTCQEDRLIFLYVDGKLKSCERRGN
jgi:hypothetical protein